MTRRNTFRTIRCWMVAALVGTACSGNAAEPPTNFVSRLPKASQEHYATVVKEAPKLAKAWQDTLEYQARIKQASVVFGVEARRNAEKELPALKAAETAARAALKPLVEAYEGPVQRRVTTLRDEVHRMRQRMADNAPESARKRLADASAEVDTLDAALRTLDEMKTLTSRGLQQIPTTTTLLGFDSKDGEGAKLAAKYAAVVEARKRVKDVEVDLEALRKDAAGTGSAQRIATLEKLLAKTKADLEGEVAKSSKAQNDEIAKLTKKLESTEKKIADMEKGKRKVPDRLQTERAEMQTALAALQKEVATIEKVAGTKPAPPAAK